MARSSTVIVTHPNLNMYRPGSDSRPTRAQGTLFTLRALLAAWARANSVAIPDRDAAGATSSRAADDLSSFSSMTVSMRSATRDNDTATGGFDSAFGPGAATASVNEGRTAAISADGWIGELLAAESTGRSGQTRS